MFHVHGDDGHAVGGDADSLEAGDIARILPEAEGVVVEAVNFADGLGLDGGIFAEGGEQRAVKPFGLLGDCADVVEAVLCIPVIEILDEGELLVCSC